MSNDELSSFVLLDALLVTSAAIVGMVTRVVGAGGLDPSIVVSSHDVALLVSDRRI